MITKETTIRVRFAPSPTGLLHVGSFRTALFNWLFARQQGGTFILRIEDTDRTRSKDEFLQSQLADMRWMGLDWDEGPDIGGLCNPYFQTQRLDTYREHMERLLQEGKAYRCYCTAEELQAERDKAQAEGKDPGYFGRCRNLTPGQVAAFEQEGRKPCVRFKTPGEGATLVQDLIKGEVSFENRLIDDFIIVKSDGIPTYNFAVVVDDYLMKITHIIRGDEHMSNTPRQALLYDAYGYPRPQFCHIPIILNPDRTKLSKRKGAVHLLEFRDKGYLREALLNFLALLGWAPKDNREILSLEDMIQAFSLDGITRHPAIFDENKLQWMNAQYIMTLPAEVLIERVKPFLEKLEIDPAGKDESWYQKALPLYRERAKTLVEFADNLSYYFKDIEEYEPAGVKKAFKPEFLPEALPEIARRIKEDPEFTETSLETLVRDYAEELGQSAGKLIQAIRLAGTGRTATPPIFDVMVLLGKDLLVERLLKATRFIQEHTAEMAAG